jgi:hypothetical protein
VYENLFFAPECDFNLGIKISPFLKMKPMSTIQAKSIQAKSSGFAS